MPIYHQPNLDGAASLPKPGAIPDPRSTTDRSTTDTGRAGGVDLAGGALPLRSLGHVLPVAALLEVGYGIATALALRHAHTGMCGRLCPDNLLMDPQGQITLQDTEVSRPRRIRYRAPEQSGRLSRTVDERADLYTLGVILYELATGTLPFTEPSPADLVHAQLTREPAPITRVRPGFPPGIAAVITRLLATLPEERYQTAQGVLADLRHCQDDLATIRPTIDPTIGRTIDPTIGRTIGPTIGRTIGPTIGKIDKFETGRADIPGRPVFTGRLVGRARQLSQLTAARERVRQSGGTELIWISSDPGLGKSALLGAFGDSIVRAGGVVARTAFQATDTGPYAGLGQLLADLAGQLLMGAGGQPCGWRARLADELGGTAPVLVALAPDLAALIGPGSPHQTPQGRPARMLLQLGVRRLLSAVTAASGPVTLLLDNVQQIDLATADLLRYVFADPETSGLLVVGAYRPREIPEPMTVLLRERGPWRCGGTMGLRALPDTALTELLTDTLRVTQRDTAELARLVADRTGANPLAVGEFLRELHERRLLSLQEQRGWRWEPTAIADTPVQPGAAPAIRDRLTCLPPRVSRILRIAAELGTPVDLATLARGTGLDRGVLVDLIRQAVRAGLLAATPAAGTYRWTHDVVRQAVRATIAEPDRAHLTAVVGKSLLTKPGPGDAELIVRLCANDDTLLGDPADRAGVAEQALAASRHAFRVGAVELADERMRTAIGLLSAQGWGRRMPLAYAVHLHAARTAREVGDPERAHRLLDLTGRYALDDLSRAQILALRAQWRRADGQHGPARTATGHALRLLGVEVPAEPGRWAAAARTTSAALTRRLAEVRVDEVARGLTASDPRTVLALDVIAGALTLSAPLDDWSALLAATGVKLVFEFGPTPAAAIVFAGHAVALADRAGHRDGPATATAARAARVALALRDSCPGPGIAARVAPVAALVRSLWYEPDPHPLTYLEDGFRAGIEDGEPTLALDNLLMAITHRFALGAPLHVLADEIDTVRRLADRHGVLERVVVAVDALGNAIARLRGVPPDGPTATLGLITGYLLGDQLDEPRTHQQPGSFLSAVTAFYQALALAARYPDTDSIRQRAIVAELAERQARLDEWAGPGPAAFGAYAALLGAERARLTGDADAAADRYGRAAEAAREHGLTTVEALAAELGGQHALTRGQTGTAVAYLRRARDCYQRWRAPALVAHIDRALAAVPTRLDRTFDQLDLLAMVRAFQAIASELSPDKLVVTLLQLLVEHTHAERGALLLPNGPRLRVAATARAEHGQVTVVADPDDPGQVPVSVAGYVRQHRRPVGGRPGELPDELSTDAYLRQHPPSALLCTPIMRDGRLIAVLYLEHRHLAGWFGAEHLDLLDVLGAQAAIALDNATTYARLAEANQILDATFDRLPIGLILLGPDLTVRRASPRALEVTGLPIEPGTPLVDLFDVLTPTDVDGLPYRLEPGFAATGDDVRPIYREISIISPYGERYQIHTAALPLRDNSGSLIGVTLWVSRLPPDPS